MEKFKLDISCRRRHTWDKVVPLSTNFCLIYSFMDILNNYDKIWCLVLKNECSSFIITYISPCNDLSPFEPIITYMNTKALYFESLFGSNKKNNSKNVPSLINMALLWSIDSDSSRTKEDYLNIEKNVYALSRDLQAGWLADFCASLQIKCFFKLKNHWCFYKKIKKIKKSLMLLNYIGSNVEILFRLSLEYPHLSLGFNWILRLKAVSDDCSKFYPCYFIVSLDELQYRTGEERHLSEQTSKMFTGVYCFQCRHRNQYGKKNSEVRSPVEFSSIYIFTSSHPSKQRTYKSLVDTTLTIFKDVRGLLPMNSVNHTPILLYGEDQTNRGGKEQIIINKKPIYNLYL
ncbi:hypothetical protein H8356DRAFT_1331515 [Neocallimastix lanati (nom. inval.)]|nr:hypothetical protein H8356DRAFT_1331515 [Neocallimastix sp. JGI-2020a]